MGDELLASLVLTCLGVWVLSYILEWDRLPDGCQQRPLLTATTGIGIIFLTLFFAVRAFLPAQATEVPAGPEVAAQSSLKGAPDERQDRQEGYRAGYALGSDPRHRGSKVPRPVELAALAAIRCKGHNDGYLEGFKRGYTRGLTGFTLNSPDEKPSR